MQYPGIFLKTVGSSTKKFTKDRQTPGKEWKSGNQKHKAAVITNIP
jgi:hypothetical protein